MNPTVLKTMLDAIFGALKSVDPSIAPTLVLVNGYIDQYGLGALATFLSSIGITSTSSITALIDGVFQGLATKFAGHTFVLLGLHLANAFIDSLIPAAAPILTQKGFTV